MLDLIVSLPWSEFVETFGTFWPAATGVDHTLVVCCVLTQILDPSAGIWVNTQATTGE